MTTELIAALEAAEGPSRELDVEIFKAIGAPVPFQFMNKLLALEYNDVEQAYFARVSDDMQVRYAPPAYTSLIDAAMTLVPKECTWHVSSACPRDAFATIESGDDRVQDFTGKASTPAIAICIAALRAKGDV